MSKPQTVRDLSVREWAGERLQNSIRIAGTKKLGPDREGWLEDVGYWRRICAALEELDTLCQAIEGHRGGALTNDGLWHYHEKARALLQRDDK